MSWHLDSGSGTGSGYGRAFTLFKSKGTNDYYFGYYNDSTGATVGWDQIFHDGYHPNADTWTTARTLTIGSTGKSVNGSANVSWSLGEIGAAAASHTHSVSEINDFDPADYLPLTGGTLTGSLIGTTITADTFSATNQVIVQTGDFDAMYLRRANNLANSGGGALFFGKYTQGTSTYASYSRIFTRAQDTTSQNNTLATLKGEIGFSVYDGANAQFDNIFFIGHDNTKVINPFLASSYIQISRGQDHLRFYDNTLADEAFYLMSKTSDDKIVGFYDAINTEFILEYEQTNRRWSTTRDFNGVNATFSGNIGLLSGGNISYDDTDGLHLNVFGSANTSTIALQVAGNDILEVASDSVTLNQPLTTAGALNNGIVTAPTGLNVDRVILSETWSGGNQTLAGQDLGTWTESGTKVNSTTTVGTPPYGGYFSFHSPVNYQLISPAFDVSVWEQDEPGNTPADTEAWTRTRLFIKGYIAAESMDTQNEYLTVEIYDGSTWHEIYRHQSNLDLATGKRVPWRKWTADITPYIDPNGANQIRFNSPYTGGSGDYVGIGNFYIYEADMPSQFGGIKLEKGLDVSLLGNVGLGGAWRDNTGTSLDTVTVGDYTTAYGITIASGASSDGAFQFANSDNAVAARLLWDKSEDELRLQTGAGALSGISVKSGVITNYQRTVIGTNSIASQEFEVHNGSNFSEIAISSTRKTTGNNIGRLSFYGYDSADNATLYAGLKGNIEDSTNTAEYGQLTFEAMNNGQIDDIGIWSWNDGLTLNTPLTIQDSLMASPFTIRGWTDGTESDVYALMPVGSSTGGTIIENSLNGHMAIGIRANDDNDSFSILFEAGTSASDDTYTIRPFQVRRNQVDLDVTLTGISATLSSGIFLNNSTGVDSDGIRWNNSGGGDYYAYVNSNDNFVITQTGTGQAELTIFEDSVNLMDAGLFNATDVTLFKPLTATSADFSSGVSSEWSRIESGGDSGLPEGTRYHWINDNTDTDQGTWWKVCDVSIPTGTFRALAFDVEVVINNSNFGSSDANRYYYQVVFSRSASVQDDNDNATVYGIRDDYLRVVKTSTGNYELQTTVVNSFDTLIVNYWVTSSGGGAQSPDSQITPTDGIVVGSTTGTIYTAQTGSTTRVFDARILSDYVTAETHIISDNPTIFTPSSGGNSGLLMRNTSATAGDGVYGASIAFGNNQSDGVRSAIAWRQEGSDSDQGGLAFFGHSATSSDPLVKVAHFYNTRWQFDTQVDFQSNVNFIGTQGTDSVITYADSGGTQRNVLLMDGNSNTISLSNRASNGNVEIRANTATAGSGGEIIVANFEDNLITANVPTTITNSGAIPLTLNRSAATENIAVRAENSTDGMYFGARVEAAGETYFRVNDSANFGDTPALSVRAETGDATFAGGVTATSFTGSGASLTSIPYSALTGTPTIGNGTVTLGVISNSGLSISGGSSFTMNQTNSSTINLDWNPFNLPAASSETLIAIVGMDNSQNGLRWGSGDIDISFFNNDSGYLTAVPSNSVGTTELDLGISPTWTGTHTFPDESNFGRYLRHRGDSDTYIDFGLGSGLTDQLRLVAGAVEFIRLSENTIQNSLTINNGQSDIDFRINTSSTASAFEIDSGNNVLNIGINTVAGRANDVSFGGGYVQAESFQSFTENSGDSVGQGQVTIVIDDVKNKGMIMLVVSEGTSCVASYTLNSAPTVLNISNTVLTGSKAGVPVASDITSGNFGLVMDTTNDKLYFVNNTISARDISWIVIGNVN